jgi:ATP-dependent Clp protease ATP-binding subunit ClpA
MTMFERFTPAARDALINARQRAGQEHAGELCEEHLLAALLLAPTTARILRQLGLDGEGESGLFDEIRAARRRGGLNTDDAAALADIGIDLELVVSRIESELGSGALGRPGRRNRPWPFRSRLPLSEGSTLTLKAALVQAMASGDRLLREEHLLLGLLTQRSAVADILRQRGVTTATVLGALDESERGDPPHGIAS